MGMKIFSVHIISSDVVLKLILCFARFLNLPLSVGVKPNVLNEIILPSSILCTADLMQISIRYAHQ